MVLAIMIGLLTGGREQAHGTSRMLPWRSVEKILRSPLLIVSQKDVAQNPTEKAGI